ncbi:Xaa-Pro aminopeptidase [Richelia intracellularis HH01]|uniref:Xaa-Pro aminopeptidase n=1 Tax=Richelia intracellularis HH01 TaxID=1165094 RepID=M1WYF6_9NOST|nr:aminopeptidase P family protein [Richelia intracellularis]CCH66842.1 Xaa-Pro aminopeptidase [Richelia intracellularis HH01]
MPIYDSPNSLSNILHCRRQKLAKLIDFPVVIWAGNTTPRNFAANHFPFRASSHFLYFAGIPLKNAVIRLEEEKLELYIDNITSDVSLWCGETYQREEIADFIGADAAFPLTELETHLFGAATIAVQDPATWTQQSQLLGRWILPLSPPQGIDLELARAIVTLRLIHDDEAIRELVKAADISVKAHLAGMQTVKSASTEAEVRAAMESIIIANNMTTAYNSIVTVHGEVLHNNKYHNPLHSGDLLLADVGAETEMGWAGDITRTFPVSGKFSSTQKDIYDVVLAAHDACIAKIRPGVEYRDIHMLACLTLTEGLVSVGILQGDPANLVERNVHSVFFPHGIGHLLGLDVHDMEDLGDLAGYKEGRNRSDLFGLSYLRLNRSLQSNMLITIEPGFYQVPAILNPARSKYKYLINWEKLELFADVRSIRIEDEVLVTNVGSKVLSADLPTDTSTIEEIIIS